MAQPLPKKVSKRRLTVKSKTKAASPGKPVSPQRIREMSWGFAPPLIAEAALSHAVFDAMDGGAKTAAQISAQTNTSLRGLTTLLDGLVGIGLVYRRGEKFTLAPDAAAFLVSTKPAYIGGMMKHVSRQLIGSWAALSECVKTGRPHRPVNSESVGGEFFAQFVEDIFHGSIGPATAAAQVLLKKAKGDVRVLDIATGSGVWGIAMAKGRPHVRVTAVDWQNVLPVTRRVAARHGVGEQFNYVEGDILQADLGSDYDIATLGQILHSEGETRSRELLRRGHGGQGGDFRNHLDCRGDERLAYIILAASLR